MVHISPQGAFDLNQTDLNLKMDFNDLNKYRFSISNLVSSQFGFKKLCFAFYPFFSPIPPHCAIKGLQGNSAERSGQILFNELHRSGNLIMSLSHNLLRI